MGDELYWTVDQHKNEIRVGDRVLLWKAKGADPDGGVYAIAEVISDPDYVATDNPYWVPEERSTMRAPRVRAKLRILSRLVDNPIRRSNLRRDPRLANLSIFRQSQGTNFPVTAQEWEYILSRELPEDSDAPLAVRETSSVQWTTQAEPKAKVGAQPEEETETPTLQLDVQETHLRQALARNLSLIEPGLTQWFEDRLEEYPVPGGRIDLLCKDKEGNVVVVELKRRNWHIDNAVGQVARYMGWAKQTLESKGQVRGILLVLDEGVTDVRLEAAQASVPGLEVRRYSTRFSVV
jgi:predicted RNA-binding protein with PUA-like domain